MKKSKQKALKPAQSEAVEKSELKKEFALNAALTRILPTINSTNFCEVVQSISEKSGVHPLVIAERIHLLRLVAE
jgi:hypothetical protein